MKSESYGYGYASCPPVGAIFACLKDTKKELVAVPYIDYQDYDSASKQVKNRTRKTVYRNTGTSTNSSAANWIRYVNVVRSAKDANHFYQTTQKILAGSQGLEPRIFLR